MSKSSRLLAWVEREVRACRPVALRHFRSSSLRVERKPDLSPVTAADREVETRLRRVIARACPGESILGEEFGRSGGDRDSYWSIDPIDGTRAFSRGLPTWGIMVGKVERGRAVLGVVDYPALGITMAAAGGAAYERAGTTVTPFAKVRRAPALADAVILHGGMRWWNSTPYFPGFRRLMTRCFLERAYGDCYGYLWAFRGHADAVLEHGVKPWDVIPLAAIAHATGRVVTDCRGAPCITGPEIVMASPAFAKVVCRTLSRAN